MDNLVNQNIPPPKIDSPFSMNYLYMNSLYDMNYLYGMNYLYDMNYT